MPATDICDRHGFAKTCIVRTSNFSILKIHKSVDTCRPETLGLIEVLLLYYP